MYFYLNRTEEIEVKPALFCGPIHTTILALLRQKYEGQCSGRYGWTIRVVKIAKCGKGKLDMESGNAKFAVEFESIVFRPFKNEVVVADVKTINNAGFFCIAGPLEIYVSATNLPPGYRFSSASNSFEMEEDATRKIEPRSKVIVKIFGIDFQATQIQAIGTLREKHLGVVTEE